MLAAFLSRGLSGMASAAIAARCLTVGWRRQSQASRLRARLAANLLSRSSTRDSTKVSDSGLVAYRKYEGAVRQFRLIDPSIFLVSSSVRAASVVASYRYPSRQSRTRSWAACTLAYCSRMTASSISGRAAFMASSYPFLARSSPCSTLTRIS